MVKIIYNIIIYITLIFSFYYVLMGVFSFLKSKKRKQKDYKNYFSILIAARNEENVIGSLIESLKKQNYDKNLYDINIIINNCTDNTAEISKSKGANVIECKNKTKCKADALRVAFDHFKNNSKIDAYIIFDADNVVHPDFLLHMNESLNEGFKVAQGNREAKNLGKSWISSSYAIYYYMQNFFFSRSRKNLGLSTTINGTGFMVKKELIDSIGFNTKTLTEDIEFSGICALNKVKIDYVESAITYDEHPVDFLTSWNQRMRWTKGTIQCFRLYGWKIIKNFFRTGSLTNVDILFLYLAPFVQVFSFMVILIDIVFNFFVLEKLNFVEMYIIKNIFSATISYIMILIGSSFVLLYNKHHIKDALSGILLFIIFIFSWFPINVVCLFKKNLEWKPIKHDNNISIDEIVQK